MDMLMRTRKTQPREAAEGTFNTTLDTIHEVHAVAGPLPHGEGVVNDETKMNHEKLQQTQSIPTYQSYIAYRYTHAHFIRSTPSTPSTTSTISIPIILSSSTGPSGSIIKKGYKLNLMLSNSQRVQLNKDILEYLVKNNLTATAQKLSQEIGVSLADVDPEGNKLEVKWKSILALQKKIANLEEQVKNLQEAAKGVPKKGPADPASQDSFLPVTPAKLELKGHKANITALAFHPQYSSMASSSDDGTIKIWEFQTGDLQRTLRGHTNPVNNVNYDFQGRLLASCSSDLSVKLWDSTNDYLCVRTLNGHNHNVSYVSFNPEGDMVFSCSRDKTIRLWQTSTGYCKKTFNGHQAWVRKLSVSKDGQTFVSGSDDQSVIVWNVNKQAPVLRFFAHDNVIETVLLIESQYSAKLMNSQFLKHKFTPEIRMNALKELSEKGANGISNYFQTFILTGGRDKLIKLFLSQTGQLLHTFTGHDNWVRNLSLHPSGKFLYSCSDDKSIRVWDLNFGKEKKKVDAHEHFVAVVKFNPKYGVIGSAGNDLVIKIWNLK